MYWLNVLPVKLNILVPIPSILESCITKQALSFIVFQFTFSFLIVGGGREM